MTLNSTTKLDAVNAMLFAIGESPINTLAGGTVVDAVTAEQVLDRVTREVLSTGWAFNTEKNFPLLRQAFAPYVFYVPPTALSCDPSDKTLEIVMRGGRLYDVVNHTFEFPDITTLECDILWNLPFEDLPEAARRYITLRAGRIFQAGAVGSESLNSFAQRDEYEAYARLRREHTRVGDKNMLTASPAVARILAR